MGGKSVLAVSIVVLVTSSAAAVQLAYDPFYTTGQHGGVGEYTLGQLDGQNPSTFRSVALRTGR